MTLIASIDARSRPTAAQLLATPFFKSAKKKSYLVDKILGSYSSRHVILLVILTSFTAGLPPLSDRQEKRKDSPNTCSHSSRDYMQTANFTASVTCRTSSKRWFPFVHWLVGLHAHRTFPSRVATEDELSHQFDTPSRTLPPVLVVFATGSGLRD